MSRGEREKNAGFTFRPGHGYDVPFKGAVHDVPSALVDHKRRFSVVASILVRFGYNPCRSVGDALPVIVVNERWSQYV